MNCTICKLPTGNIVGSVLPQCKCGWQAPQPPVTQRTWVGLTDDERYALADDVALAGVPLFEVICEAEAKLKAKNGFPQEEITE